MKPLSERRLFRTAVASTVTSVAASLGALAAPAAAAPADLITRDHLGPATQDHLKVTYSENDGTAAHKTYELTCGPAGGSHPSPAEACERLDGLAAEGSDPFRPVARDAMCTQVYGGAQTAHVTGTWRGQPVDASFKRTDGCQISRWNTLVPVLPSTGA
ncbi:SSI family serine proteinase inhibitor [Streptomyces sp. NRRL B-1347]|uniref:SSI family serine proteinase inhibitor n=1 Tax=Streptomyces sp. NRRL B-1347 TaxID=1476877 RepID=UPI0004C871D0|nr:SSI family serine proteinase inhibitor [Streptomyces sp. NRRL B-1347]